MTANHEKGEAFLGSRWNFICIGFALVGGFFLITEHRAHVFGALPYLLLLACPLMHLFGHHGDHGHAPDKPEAGAARRSPG